MKRNNKIISMLLSLIMLITILVPSQKVLAGENKSSTETSIYFEHSDGSRTDVNSEGVLELEYSESLSGAFKVENYSGDATFADWSSYEVGSEKETSPIYVLWNGDLQNISGEVEFDVKLVPMFGGETPTSKVEIKLPKPSIYFERTDKTRTDVNSEGVLELQYSESLSGKFKVENYSGDATFADWSSYEVGSENETSPIYVLWNGDLQNISGEVEFDVKLVPMFGGETLTCTVNIASFSSTPDPKPDPTPDPTPEPDEGEGDNTPVNGDELSWTQFLGNEKMKGITDAKTPVSASNTLEKWAITKANNSGMETDWAACPGAPVIVGDYAYSYIKEEIHKINIATGEIVNSAPAPGAEMFFVNIAYGDGKIFVPRSESYIKENGWESTKPGGYIVAYDADTLKELYRTEHVDLDTINSTQESGQPQSQTIYHDGYIYMGMYGGSFAAFKTEDVNTSTSKEVVPLAWKMEKEKNNKSDGFNWTGIEFVGNTGIFSSNNGMLYSVNSKTGSVISKVNLKEYHKETGGWNTFSVTSTPNYYEKNNRIYISASPGYVFSFEVNKDGSIDTNTMKKFTSKTMKGIKSSPVIYNDRLYITGGGDTAGGGEPFRVIDANTMEEIYSIDEINSKATPILTTAYATKENNNQVYLYVSNYDKPNNIYVVKDSVGQTKPSYELLATPSKEEYSSQTFAVDKNGNLIYYNDSLHLFAFGQKEEGNSVYTGTDVYNQIKRLPEVNDFGYYNAVEIKRIELRYNELSDSEKAVVTNYQKIKDINAISSQSGVERINNGIASINLDKITIDDFDKVQVLLNGYNKLSNEDKEKIIGYDTLLLASKKIEELRSKLAIDKIIEEIGNLPKISDVTSKTSTTTNSIRSKIGNLSEEDQKKITNIDILTKVENRIKEIKDQLIIIDKLIIEKLSEIDEVTLDTRAAILEIDEACKNVPLSDVYDLVNYEYYVSPAKAEIVNILINENLFSNDKQIVVTEDNVEHLNNIIKEIEYYYTGVLESDKKYIKNYKSVEIVRSDIEKLVPSTVVDTNTKDDEPGNTIENIPSTGDENNIVVTLAIMLFAMVGLVIFKKRDKKVIK